MSFLSSYFLFLAKTVTLLISIIFIILSLAKIKTSSSKNTETQMKANSINDRFSELKDTIIAATSDKKEWKNYCKEQKNLEKNRAKNEKSPSLPKLYVLDFEGDIDAQPVYALREQVSALIQTIDAEKDQVLLRLESMGGYVHSYGLASSQLLRLRDKGIKLTIAVDKVAASGGYLMASVGTEIIAAPFAIIGSIGVVGAMPNFHDLMEKYGVHYEQHTAGEHKRTITMFGKNTDADREQFQKELKETHDLFKEHIKKMRPQLDLNRIATGETWYGSRAIEMGLIDKIQTSDDFLLEHLATYQIIQLEHEKNMSLIEKIKSEFLNTKLAIKNIIKPLKAKL